MELTYLGAVRDEVTHRVVDPLGVVVVDGYGYVRGYCRSAGGLRMFRVDRIRSIAVSDLPARTVEAPGGGRADVGRAGIDGPRGPRGRCRGAPLLDRHPVTRRWALPEGGVRAELPVGDFTWARRLVLGSAGTVVLREPDWLVAELIDTARGVAPPARPGNRCSRSL